MKKLLTLLLAVLLLAGCAQETPDRAGSSKTSEEKMDVSVAASYPHLRAHET